ncbi:hypothetical protein V1522DRAFT_445025 [Lipomyces starkeyi]
MDLYLEQLSTRRAEAEEVGYTNEVVEEVDSTDEVFDIDEPQQIDCRVLLLREAFCGSPPLHDAPLSSSPLSDSSSMYLDNAHADRFGAIRKSLDSVECDCGGLRKVCRRFKSTDQAQLALKILQSDLYHLVDPLIVSDGQVMTVEEYERLCCKEVKRKHLKLYRAPLAFDPATISTGPRALPVDPYFLGLWPGDGTAISAEIASADREIPVWLQSYVDRLNSSRKPGARELYLTKVVLAGWQGDEKRVACPQVETGYAEYPVLDGLRKLGLLRDKSGGINSTYMTADEDTRLAVIAGLIDSDGYYDTSNNTYRFTQSTEGHRKIVYDLKELALSCGISVLGHRCSSRDENDSV